MRILLVAIGFAAGAALAAEPGTPGPGGPAEQSRPKALEKKAKDGAGEPKGKTETPAQAAPSESPAQGGASEPPAKVGPEALRLLESTLSINVREMRLGQALQWYQKLTENPVPMRISPKAAETKVSLELVDQSWAAALRILASNFELDYRVLDGAICIARKAELAEAELVDRKGAAIEWKKVGE